MPLPKPQGSENRAEFISRCTSDEIVQNDSVDDEQALAICISIWDERNMSPNEKLLTAIKSRGDDKPDPFGYGILTADRYTKSMLDCVGIDACYKFAATKMCSFDDIMRKAANTLVYSNEDMLLDEVHYEKKPGAEIRQLDIGDVAIDLPKNTLLVFQHILTSPLKDRDGDILRTQGARVDPSLPLLWQHVHTLPIGKALKTIEHTREVLSMISAIVDTNELSHDAAVLLDNGVLRFSHGFRALDFEEMKTDDGEFNGFDIKDFEIMEESLVSVPSNTDANVQEIMLSMIEGGKLTSPLMKATGRSIREQRPISVPVEIDISVNVKQTEEKTNADEPRDESGGKDGACSCPSKETDAAEVEAKAVEAKSTEVNLAQAKRFLDVAEAANDERKRFEVKHEQGDLMIVVPARKSGRVMSHVNLQKLLEIKADIEALAETEGDLTRGGKLLCESCIEKLDSIIDAATPDEEVDHKPSVKDAMAVIFTASDAERKQVFIGLLGLQTSNAANRLAEDYRALIGRIDIT